jgi:hypothetical protein
MYVSARLAQIRDLRKSLAISANRGQPDKSANEIEF